MQSTISSTEFYAGKEIRLTATPDDSGAYYNLFYWVINFTTNDLQYSIQELTDQDRIFIFISSSNAFMAIGTTEVIQQTNSINTLTPLLLEVPETQNINSVRNTALNSNAFFVDTGITYNITWVNPPAPSKTITGIVTWLRNWFNTKEEIDEMILTDSGWQNCTMASGYAVYTSGTNLRVRKVGKIVHATGVFKNNNTLSASSNVQFATLPSGYRPSQEQVKICQGSDLYRWLLRIKADGAMTLSRYGTNSDASASSGRWLPYCITYMVD